MKRYYTYGAFYDTDKYGKNGMETVYLASDVDEVLGPGGAERFHELLEVEIKMRALRAGARQRVAEMIDNDTNYTGMIDSAGDLADRIIAAIFEEE